MGSILVDAHPWLVGERRESRRKAIVVFGGAITDASHRRPTVVHVARRVGVR
jgi:hypothetical protein